MIEAVIFDMDGLMIDSEPFHFKAYQVVLEGFGIAYAHHDNEKYVGRSDIEVSEDLVKVFHIPISGKELYQKKKTEYGKYLRNHIKAKDGLFEILAYLKHKNYTLALASSSPIDEIEIVVNKFHIKNHYNLLISGDFVAKSKPEPDIFLLTAHKLGIEPENCLVLEDSFNGLRSAKAAGMKCFVIPDKSKDLSRFEKADLILNSLLELKKHM